MPATTGWWSRRSNQAGQVLKSPLVLPRHVRTRAAAQAQFPKFITKNSWYNSVFTLNTNSDTTYNGVCSTLLNNCEEGTLTEIGHQEDAEHSTPGGLAHTINQK
ncbi:hypothetical protein OUZ56_033444 [Daphnia magna]|uniref:Uncharacterized protein n=1 Tax=Daphnia magna TaxID=35525 RepID=A0ABQ9ZXV4_9CRUS|nr:hypothetical protein OUZ56_033444 [Daphnia magna]